MSGRLELSCLRWRTEERRRRFALAWRYATGRLSEADADLIRYDCQSISGCYPLATFTRDSVLEVARDRWGDHPHLTDAVNQACERVASKWSGNAADSAQDAAECWAMDLISEWAAEQGLTDLWNEPEDEA